MRQGLQNIVSERSQQTQTSTGAAALGWLRVLEVAALCVAIVTASAVAGIAAVSLLGAVGDRATLVWLLAMQAATVVLTWAAAMHKGIAPAAVLGLTLPASLAQRFALAFAGLIVVIAPFNVLVLTLDPAAYRADLAPFAALIRSEHAAGFAVAVAFGAPLSEELLFRGLLLPALAATPLGWAGATLITVAAWTAMHAGYSNWGLAEVFLIGLYLSWLRARGNGLWPPLLCHAAYNLLLLMILRWTSWLV